MKFMSSYLYVDYFIIQNPRQKKIELQKIFMWFVRYYLFLKFRNKLFKVSIIRNLFRIIFIIDYNKDLTISSININYLFLNEKSITFVKQFFIFRTKIFDYKYPIKLCLVMRVL